MVCGLIMVKASTYSFSDIDESDIYALDKYIKTIIVNVKKHFTIKEDVIFNNEFYIDDLDNLLQTKSSVKHDYRHTYLGYGDGLNSIEDFELFSFLLQLSELERDIIIYNVFQGYRINEIAQIKGLTDKTIRKYKKLAFEKIKAYLYKM